MEVDRVGGEVTDEPLEDQVDDVPWRLGKLSLLEDQLPVGQQREQLGERQLEVEVLAICSGVNGAV